jgi:hypothetical protein
MAEIHQRGAIEENVEWNTKCVIIRRFEIIVYNFEITVVCG